MDVLPASATFSKDIRTWSGDPDWHPRTLIDGKGAYVKGEDGHWYLDLTSALGSNLLGYRSPYLTRKLVYQVKHGIGFTLPHRAEVEAAEKLVTLLGAHVPGWSADDLQVRWVLGGSEACEAAVTLARAVTGRKWVLSCLYHGWHAMYTGLTPPAYGIVPDRFMMAVPYGDLDTLALAFQQHPPVAALIIEQPPQGSPTGFWPGVRRLCDDYGALLVLDEVVTGFRASLGGIAQLYGIRPDICCYGKALGGSGVPVGSLIAPRKYMRFFNLPNPVFVSATAAGNALSLAAASAMLDLWDESCVNHLWSIGNALMTGLEGAGYVVTGRPYHFLVQHESPAHRAYFIIGMRDRGILANRPWLPNLAHTLADIAQTVKAAEEIKVEMAKIDVEAVMAGKLPMVLFENR